MALRLGVQFLTKRVLFRSSPIIHSRTISLSTASRRNEVAHVIESTPGTILGINRLQLLYDDCYTASQIHRFTTGTLLQADNSISAEGIQSVEPARPSVLKEEYMYDEPLPDKSPFYAEMSEYPCAQGVQGNDEKQFAEWLESCRRFGLQNCQEQLQGVQSGRKSLSQVIAEQEELIRTIAEDHRVNARAQQGVQDDAADHLCPQGLQGEDHTKFTEWLQTCRQFGFGHCMDNIQGIQSGRKTLSQVMQEQDDLIQQVVRKKHTKAVPDQEKQVGGSTGSSSEYTSPSQLPPSLPSSSSPPPPPSSSSDSTASMNNPGDAAAAASGGKVSSKLKLKQAVRDYGSTVIVFHVVISLASLGGCYLAVSSGLDMVALINWLGVDKTILPASIAAGASTFVMAYAIHKMLMPIRIAITLTATPIIVRSLRARGILKPPKTPTT